MPTINEQRIPDKLVQFRQEVDAVTPDDIATKDIWLTKIRFSNTTGAAITVTLKDKQGTPIENYSGVSIPNNGVSLEVSPPYPLLCPGGADVLASAVGLFAEIIGYTKP